MTRDEILAMVPGRELDALIAGRVFNLIVWFDPEGEPIVPGIYLGTPIPHFSTNILAALAVVDKLKLTLIPQRDAPKELSYLCRYNEGPLNLRIELFAETAPEAICKAALLAKEVTQ